MLKQGTKHHINKERVTGVDEVSTYVPAVRQKDAIATARSFGYSCLLITRTRQTSTASAITVLQRVSSTSRQ